MRRVIVAAAAVALTVVVTACSAAADAEPVETDVVDLPRSYRFSPEVISVESGTTVTWTNHDQFSHSVRLLDDGGQILTMAPGESVSFTFKGPGEHRYDCSFHPHDMSGVVVVTED